MGQRKENEVEVRRIALMESDVVTMKLPPAPVKVGDSRAANWDGLGQVELDAVEPSVLRSMCEDAIKSLFDQDLYNRLKEQEAEERAKYILEVKRFVNSLNS